jgi:hypothetical protein
MLTLILKTKRLILNVDSNTRSMGGIELPLRAISELHATQVTERRSKRIATRVFADIGTVLDFTPCHFGVVLAAFEVYK